MCKYVFTYYNKRWRKHLNANFINDNNHDCFLQNYLRLYVLDYLLTLGSEAYIFTMIYIDRIFLPNEIPNLTQIMVDGLNICCCVLCVSFIRDRNVRTREISFCGLFDWTLHCNLNHPILNIASKFYVK